jgi:hypothetical protein
MKHIKFEITAQDDGSDDNVVMTINGYSLLEVVGFLEAQKHKLLKKFYALEEIKFPE